MLGNRTCKGRKERGVRCGARPLPGSSYCLFHDPAHAEAVAEGRRLGGLRRRREGTVAAAYDFQDLGSVPNIRRLVEVAVMDTLGLENSVSRNRTLAYLAQVALTLLDKGEWEERLEALEAALGPRAMQAGG